MNTPINLGSIFRSDLIVKLVIILAILTTPSASSSDKRVGIQWKILDTGGLLLLGHSSEFRAAGILGIGSIINEVNGVTITGKQTVDEVMAIFEESERCRLTGIRYSPHTQGWARFDLEIPKFRKDNTLNAVQYYVEYYDYSSTVKASSFDQVLYSRKITEFNWRDPSNLCGGVKESLLHLRAEQLSFAAAELEMGICNDIAPDQAIDPLNNLELTYRLIQQVEARHIYKMGANAGCNYAKFKSAQYEILRPYHPKKLLSNQWDFDTVSKGREAKATLEKLSKNGDSTATLFLAEMTLFGKELETGYFVFGMGPKAPESRLFQREPKIAGDLVVEKSAAGFLRGKTIYAITQLSQGLNVIQNRNLLLSCLKNGDPLAFEIVAYCLWFGEHGFEQNRNEAVEILTLAQKSGRDVMKPLEQMIREIQPDKREEHNGSEYDIDLQNRRAQYLLYGD